VGGPISTTLIRPIRCAALSLSVALAAACGSAPPAAPSSTAGASTTVGASTPSPAKVVLVSTPVSPANDEKIISGAALSLVASHTDPISGDPVLVTFQVARDEAFTVSVSNLVVTQTAGGAAAPYDTSLGSLPERTNYWRVRAGSGESLGPWSDARRFVVTARPVTEPDARQLFAEAPALVAPPNGATAARFATYTVRNARHSDGPTAYYIQASEDPTFAHGIVSGGPCAEFWWTATTDCTLNLPKAARYFWRAQAATSYPGYSYADGIKGPFSAVSEVIVTGERIHDIDFISPVRDTIDHPRPTFTITNAAVDGRVGPMAYVFSLLPGSGAFGAISSATVPEGAGTTSWTPPFDLMVGATYTIQANGIDTVTGVSGFPMGRRFLVTPRASRLLNLTIIPPGGRCGGDVTIPATSEDMLTSPTFALSTYGSLVLRLSGATGTLAGNSQYRIISAPGDASAPAVVVVTEAGEARLAGSFEGRYEYDPDGYYHTCSTTAGFRWVVTPR
jgi:hypothetical protein